MSLTGYFPRDKFFEATEFDADRVHRGLAGLLERHPKEMLYRNLALKLAWYREDAEEAARLLEGFAPTDWREEAWKYSSYRAARDWAKLK